MKVLEQGGYFHYVNRLNEKEITAQSILITTHFEGSATLVFDEKEFRINDARWSIHRSTDKSSIGEGQIEDLLGKSAYLDGGKAIKSVPDYSRIVKAKHAPGYMPKNESESDTLDDSISEAAQPPEKDSYEWTEIKELFLECIRGAFQAEEYLLHVRGYKDLNDYEAFWQSDKKDYCRPYTGQMPAIEAWPLYSNAFEHYREDNLYNKYKSFCLIDRGDGKTYAIGTYNDSFHEMNVEIDFESETGIITSFDMTTVRVPFEPCKELNHSSSELFIGLDIRGLKKRDVGKLIGGKMGCFHLVDIVTDIAASAGRVR